MKRYIVPFLRATLAGLITASALPFLFAVVVLLISIFTGESAEGQKTILFLFFVFVGTAGLIIAGTSLVLGLPISFILRRFGYSTHSAHVVAGVALGFLALLLILATGEQTPNYGFLLLYLYSALVGGVTADSWWRNSHLLMDAAAKPT